MRVPMVTVKYSCNECGVDKAEVEIVARTTEDVVEWVKFAASCSKRAYTEIRANYVRTGVCTTRLRCAEKW